MLAPSSPAFLQLVYRPDLKVLVSRWMRQTTTQDMHLGYGLMLDESETQKCVYWLVDARRRDRAANEQELTWMIEVFFPLVAVRLRQPAFIAYLLSPAHFTDIETNTAIPPLTYFDSQPCRIGRFIEERTALEWLTACRVASGKEDSHIN